MSNSVKSTRSHQSVTTSPQPNVTPSPPELQTVQSQPNQPPTTMVDTSNHGPNPPENDDDSTIASSTLASIATSQWKTLFPPTNVPAKFNHKTETFMKDILGLQEVLRMRLCQFGLVNPHEIVNAFGMNDNDIISHFLQLGYKFLVDPNTAESCTKLFMFARSQTLNMKITPDPDKQIIPRAVRKTYNQRFSPSNRQL